MSAKPKRYGYVDALRGYAILGVLVCHAALTFSRETIAKTGSRPLFPGLQLAEAGQFGVQLFFLTSIFTLFLSLRSRKRHEIHPTRNFFIRRFFRVAPLFWAGILFYLWFEIPWNRAWAPNGLDSWQIATTFAFLHGWHPESINSVVPGGWSIAVEMNFYLLLPFLFTRVTTLRKAVLWMIVLAFAGRAASILAKQSLIHPNGSFDGYLASSFAIFWLPMQLPIFFGGIVLFHLMGTEEERHKLIPWRWWFLGGAVGGCIFLAYSPMFGLPLASEPIPFGMVLMLFVIHLGCRPEGILVNRWIRGLGKISFSCYICHFFVLHELGKHLEGWIFADLEPPLGYILNCGWLLTVSLLVSSIIAMISYSLIERPGIRLGNKLVEKLEENALKARA